MLEVEVFKFHYDGRTEKKTMTHDEFKKLKSTNSYRYVAYQIGFNQTIIDYENNR